MRFDFAYEIERDLFDKIPAIRRIASHVASTLGACKCGMGVKFVAVGIIAVEPDLDERFPVMKPKYRAGKRVNTEFGLRVELEDTLEFDIKVPVKDLRSASSDAQLAAVIRRGMGFAFPALLEQRIPDFNMQCLVSSVEDALREVAESGN